jgi:hypothetical protein
MYAQETGEAIIPLIEITHDDLTEPIRVARNDQNIVSNGNTYIGYPFDVAMPGNPAEGAIGARITIDNVDRAIIAALRALTSPPEVKIQIVLLDTPDVVEEEHAYFKLVSAKYTRLVITGTISVRYLGNDAYPVDSFLPSTFPGIF